TWFATAFVTRRRSVQIVRMRMIRHPYRNAMEITSVSSSSSLVAVDVVVVELCALSERRLTASDRFGRGECHCPHNRMSWGRRWGYRSERAAPARCPAAAVCTRCGPPEVLQRQDLECAAVQGSDRE